MLTFVEAGNRFTNEYGDIDEPFYEGLELMLADFRDMLLTNPGCYEEGDLAQRLIELGREAGGLGWGYGDFVTETVGDSTAIWRRLNQPLTLAGRKSPSPSASWRWRSR